MEAQFEALAAWVDGEPVPRTDVAVALESHQGRDYVLDLMALRRLVEATTPTLAPLSKDVAARRPRRWPAFAAAAAVVLCTVGGFAAGRILGPQPPALSQTTEGQQESAATPASITAPAPTRVIQLEESANWRESGGS